MNKLFTALLVTACAGAMAQSVVYDYSANIKRIQPEIKKVKVNKDSKLGERYKVVSDKIVGYVQLPKCKICSNGTLGTYETTADDPNPTDENFVKGSGTENEDAFVGTAWLTRNDSTLKKAAKAGDINYITVVKVKAAAALFGSFVDITLTQATNEALDPKNAKNVWMSLSYAIPNNTAKLKRDPYKFKGANGEDFYGMLGFNQTTGTTVYETGFGTADTTITKGSSANICQSSTPDSTCVVVKQVSGTITGWPAYSGPCESMAMWDICGFDAGALENGRAVISGTWTIKYNKSLTDAGNDAAQATAILAKLNSNLGKNASPKAPITSTTEPKKAAYN